MRLHTFRKKGRLFHCLVKNEIIIIPIECHPYVKVPILSSFVRPIVKRESKTKGRTPVSAKPQNQILILGYARVERHAMPGRLY